MINRVWLLQSGRWYDNPLVDEDGFSKYIEFSYMGAAEYEMKYHDGELVSPMLLSLQRATQNIEQYKYLMIDKIKNKDNDSMILYCKEEDYDELVPILRKLAKGKHETKRPTMLRRYLESTKGEREKNSFIVDFWWDIENDYAIFFDESKRNVIDECMTYYDIKFNDKKLKRKGIWNFLNKN